MIPEEIRKQIIEQIELELKRIEFGKLFIELNIKDNRILNIQVETRRSMNIIKK